MSMKVLLYLEGKSILEKSGIGRALHHQMRALDLAGIPYTTDILGDYDVVHINTYGPRSLMLLHAAKRRGKKVIMHGHSTREDFENSFIGSNFMASLFGKYLAHMYQKADYVITPSEYSKKLIQSYGVTTPIIAVSNGIDLKNTARTHARKKFSEITLVSRKDNQWLFVRVFTSNVRELKILSRLLRRCHMFVSFG